MFRNQIKPFDANGNYRPTWMLYNHNYDRVFCSRFYYRNRNERLNVYLFNDGSVMVSDYSNEAIFHSF